MHEHQNPGDSVAQVLPGKHWVQFDELVPDWRGFCLPVIIAEEAAARFTAPIGTLLNDIETAFFDYIQAELSPKQRAKVRAYYQAISELEQAARYDSVKVIAKAAAYVDPKLVGLDAMLQDALRRGGETAERVC